MTTTIQYDFAVTVTAKNRRAAENVAQYIKDDLNGRDFGDEVHVLAYVAASGVVAES